MLKANDINTALVKNDKLIKKLGLTRSGRTLILDDYKIKFVVSKYGYDESYGLNFFLRAEYDRADKDEWGNLLEPFKKGNILDIDPINLYEFDKSAKSELTEIYDPPRNLNKVGNKFAAWGEEDLEKLIVFLLPRLVSYIKAQ